MEFFGFNGGKPTKITAPYKQDFYLISCGALHPKEMPEFIQTYQRQLAELEAFKIQAAVIWSERTNATPEAATVWLEQSKSVLWMQYLQLPDRIAAQTLGQKMNELGSNYSAHIATQMMQYRLGWHIVLAEKAAIGFTQLKIESPWFSSQRILCEGDRLKSLSGAVVTIAENYRGDEVLTDEVLTVCKLPRQLPQGEPLFLLNANGGYEQGDPNWGMANTTEFLTKECSHGKTQLEQIQDFYAAESAKEEVKEEEEIPLADDSTTSENTPNQTLSIGTESTADSLTWDPATQDLWVTPSS